MVDLHGKRILVAGGTGNVGRHLVQAQLAAGATVVVPSRAPEKLDALEGGLAPGHRTRFVPLVGDVTDEGDAPRLLQRAGPLDGAVASLGGYVPAPSLLDAEVTGLQRALQGYVIAHFAVARALIPALRGGGGYVMINGPLAFEPMFPGTGLVSIATAAQAMLARVLMKETPETAVRVNEVVVYSSFGRGDEGRNRVTGSDIGRQVAYLLSDEGAGVRGRTIHLRSPDALAREA